MARKKVETRLVIFEDSRMAFQGDSKITEDTARQQTAYVLLYSRVDSSKASTLEISKIPEFHNFRVIIVQNLCTFY